MSMTDEGGASPGWGGSGVRSRTSSVAEVRATVQDLIHSGFLGPGDRLPSERELCEELEVSRATLREALSAMRADGYVQARRGVGGGTFVTTLDQPYRSWIAQMRERAGALGDIIDLRKGVEGQIARLAAVRRSSADLAALQECCATDEESLSVRVFRQRDAAFHRALARAAGSQRLERAMNHARGELFVPASDPMVDERGVVTTRDQHKAIVQAVSDGDEDVAYEMMVVHLEQTRRDISGVLWPEV